MTKRGTKAERKLDLARRLAFRARQAFMRGNCTSGKKLLYASFRAEGWLRGRVKKIKPGSRADNLAAEVEAFQDEAIVAQAKHCSKRQR